MTEDARTRPTQTGAETQMLGELLDFLRQTAVRKVVGLTEEQAHSAPLASSELTPAGVVHHLAATERWWFSIDFAARDVPAPYDEVGGDGGFGTQGLTLAEVVADYERECGESRQVIAAATGLDELAQQPPDAPFTLRYAVAHMIEETARHCGHLDILREAIDGSRGE